jgi:hypothetical protein
MSDFWLDRQTGKTTRLADYVLRTPGAVLVVAHHHLVRYVLQLRPALRGAQEPLVLTPDAFGLRYLKALRGRAHVQPIREVVVDDCHLMGTRGMRDIRLFCEASGARLRFKVSAKEAGHEPET